MRSKSLYGLTLLVAIGIAWAYFTPVDISVNSRGIVRPLGDPIRVISEIGGRISSINVSEGVHVHAGDTLLQLDTRDFLLKREALHSRIHFTEMRLADIQRQLSDATSIETLDHTAAETALESARIRFARSDLLFASGLIPRQAHNESRSALAQAEMEESRRAGHGHLDDVAGQAIPLRAELAALYPDLEQTQLDLDRRTITSPTGGQITSLASLHPNEILSPGTPIAAIVPATHSLVVESWLPTSDRANIAPGQLVRLRSDDDTFDGAILSISPDARFNESLSGTYRVLITPADEIPGLRLGLTLDVRFIIRQQRLLYLLFDKLRLQFN